MFSLEGGFINFAVQFGLSRRLDSRTEKYENVKTRIRKIGITNRDINFNFSYGHVVCGNNTLIHISL